MSDDKEMTLAERMKAKRAAQKAAETADDDNGMTLAERMKARKAAEKADEPMSLAEKMRAKREAGDDNDNDVLESGKKSVKPTSSLAEKMRQRKSGATGGSLADRMRQRQDDDDNIDPDDDTPLDDEAAAELEEKIEELGDLYSELVDRVKLTSIVEEIAGLGNLIEKLPQGIEEVRDRGYVYRKYLEGKVEVMAEQWDELNREAKRWVREESDDLEQRLDRAEALVEKISEHTSPNAAQQTLANRLETLLENLDDKVDAAEDHIEGLYSALQREVSTTNQQLVTVTKLLQEKEEASFDFAAGENVYAVARAEYDDGGKKPDGNFFITDQRIIFEQKEKAGGTLGFGKKNVQQMLWEVPISAIEQVTSEDKGMFGGKDMVSMTLGSGAPFREVTIEVKGGIDSKVWARQIRQMAADEIETAVEPDPELVERLRNAPTECPTCGGMLPQVMQGQNDVTCRYCGTVIRI